MMNQNLIAKAAITIHADRDKVWEALIDPTAIKQYMFNTQVVTDWQVGSPIVWKGEWQGKPYEDKGQILQFKPKNMVQYSHFSPLSGEPDLPENYHIVTVELSNDGEGTRVVLVQDKNATEEDRIHSEQNWTMMLNSLEKYLEG